jgi:pyruvate,water dikinase
MKDRSKKLVLKFSEISAKDVPLVGGKNASLGEMFNQLTQKGVKIPDGYAITSEAFWYYLRFNRIDKKLKEIFTKINRNNLKSLQEAGKEARQSILNAKFPPDLEKEILENYRWLSKKYGQKATDVAVRSSATAEDLADASFAGQHESFLNIKGEKEVLIATKKCIASLFNDRAITYRREKGFDDLKIALSVGILKMVRSDLGSAGVMFTLDTETGFSNVVLINSIWGIGEMIVKGKITPDEFYVFKPTLKKGFKSIIIKKQGRKSIKYIYSKKGGLKEVNVPQKEQIIYSINEKDVLTLAKWAVIIEEHYKRPQDIEWAKDGLTGELFIVQSRPETIYATEKNKLFEEYKVTTNKKPIVNGIAIGNKIGQGKVRVIPEVAQIRQFQKGEVLVTKMTDPDWVSIFPLASAIITDEGGKTCHAAIVSRELGVPCIVGTNNATKVLKTGEVVTADCTQGLNGRVFQGRIPFKINRYDLSKIPKLKNSLKTKIMMNVGAPEIAFKNSFLPNDGVGLARIEFILAEKIRIHPLALYHFDHLKDKKLKEKIEELTFEYKNKKDFFVKELAEGMSQIASAFYPNPVIIRMSDFKTNEYKNLIGGAGFEGEESNPMLGFRGASRYTDPSFKPAFEMECKALKRAREEFGLKNIWAMVPFCRTIDEGQRVIKVMKENGLERGKNGLKIIVMCEIPSNVILANKFLQIFDGMSIGSNDLTQLTLGLDRDNGNLAYIGDERNEAVKTQIKNIIKICRQKGKYIGICGQAPSDFPEFAAFIMKEGIGSMSLNPDTVVKTILSLAKIKK